MSDMLTISKKELEALIAEAIAKNTLPRMKKDFRDVHFTSDDIEKINVKYPIISQKLSRLFASQVTDLPSTDEIRRGRSRPYGLYSRRRYNHGINNYAHHKVCEMDIQSSLRRLSLAVMGATVIKDLDDDEFEHALEVYTNLKSTFLELYENRISKEELIEEEREKGSIVC